MVAQPPPADPKRQEQILFRFPVSVRPGYAYQIPFTVYSYYHNARNGVSTCLDHTLHVVVGPRTPSHEPPVRHRIDLYGVLKQAVEQQSTRP